jgi:cobalt/nickel transport system permease protein
MSRNRKFLLAGLVLALFLAGVVSFYASSAPDGLEKVASDQGIDAKAKDHSAADGPLADYGTKGVDNNRLSGGLAGLAGVLLTFAVGGVLFVALSRRRPRDADDRDADDRDADGRDAGGRDADAGSRDDAPSGTRS